MSKKKPDVPVKWSGEKALKELPVKPVKLAGKIAKRDFVIHQNEFHFEIKEGDDLSEIPERFHQNLKTEQVI